MERRKVNRVPSAIFCSDMHLREDVPTCFTGDWDKEQWEAVMFISNLQTQYQCPVFNAGDLFHHWKPSPNLLTLAMQYLPKQFYSIAGQHDLPQHNWELRFKSGIFTLVESGHVKDEQNLHGFSVEFCHYGFEPKNRGKILLWHHLTYQTKPFPGASGGMAEGILRKYPQFSLIVTGDNHQSFSVEYKGRLLVNPGNITRQTADQADFQPRVALWYAETNTIEWVNLPKQEGVISREHIEIKEERDKRIDSFIDQLNGDWSAGTSFEDNIEQFKNSNDIQPDVMDIVYKAMEDGTD